MDASGQSKIISLLYEGILSSSGWELALKELAAICGAAQAVLLVWDHHRDKFAITEGYTADSVLRSRFMQEYNREFELIDPSKDVANSIPLGTVYQDHRHLGEKVISQSPFYAEFFHRYGVSANMAARLCRKGDLEYVMSFQREKDRGNFEISAEAALMRLMSHLQRAAELRFKFNQAIQQAELAKLALDRLNFPVAIVRFDGEIALCNKLAADDLMSAESKLQGMDRTSAKPIRRLLDQALGKNRPPQVGGIKIPARTSVSHDTYVIALPIRGQTAFLGDSQGALAMILLLGKNWEPIGSTQLIQEIFALTAAECRVAKLMLSDLTTEEIADRFHVSPETIRTQIKSILRKTGTRRRSEAIRLFTKIIDVPRSD